MRNNIQLLFFLFFPVWLWGQYSGEVHYTVKDGLPSSTSYCTVQDNQGFVWIATESGLVRFDGTSFKTFSTDDGLPDNEVLGLSYDEETERLWVVTYSKEPCYYYNSALHNKGNDPSLRSIKCKAGEFVHSNSQKGYGVFLYSGGNIYQCVKGQIVHVSEPQLDGINQIHKWGDTLMDISTDDKVLGRKGGQISKYNVEDVNPDNDVYKRGMWIGNLLFRICYGSISIYDKRGDNYLLRGEIKLWKGALVNTIDRIGSKYIFSAVGQGVYSIDTALQGKIDTIWAGNINSFMVDTQGDLWMATNNGLVIKKKKSAIIRNVLNGLTNENVTSIAYSKERDEIYCGNTSGQLFRAKGNSFTRIDMKYVGRFTDRIERIRAISVEDDHLLVVASNLLFTMSLSNEVAKSIVHSSGGPKCLLKLQDHKTTLVGSNESILVGQSNQWIREDNSLKRIITMIQHPDGRVFCGSIDGIYEYKDSTLSAVNDEQGKINMRIASLAYSADSLMWIGTASDGVLIFDGKKILGQVNPHRYLSYHGAICRKIIAGKPGEIWVATNGGINKIRYHYSDSLNVDNVTSITMADGMPSEDVNDIMLRDSLLYAGTAHGLCILNVEQLLQTQAIPVYIMSIRINDQDSQVHQSPYHLGYLQNNLKIEYIGVQLPSALDIRYQYRLLGSGNDRWTITNNTSIEFRSLSAGDYTFEVAVLDKYGVRSKETATVRFHITPAFYNTFWFWGLIFVFVMGVGFLIIRSIFERRRERYEKDQSYIKKIMDLEQQALKAQMNPHFIFNCLTAIQHYVNTEDVYSANMYLSNFAKLIRKTLDLSGEQYISLDKEVAYLETYIQLERMRFQNQFSYSIKVDEDIDVYAAHIPPMLLQPIIENAIRHGLRHKEGPDGALKINFVKEGNSVVCQIDDNGIGMLRSRQLKTNTHVEYQSKGMKLTESRIVAINVINEQKISMETVDKFDESGNANGTIVIIRFEQEQSA